MPVTCFVHSFTFAIDLPADVQSMRRDSECVGQDRTDRLRARPGRPRRSAGSTGGTAKAIADAGLPVTNVSDVTGFPEMMDGRVKTLHPKIHGGILARRHRARRSRAAAGAGHRARRSRGRQSVSVRARRPRIPRPPFDELVEQIDIGGPSLVRAAAKNFRDVDRRRRPGRLRRACSSRARRQAGRRRRSRFELAQKAFAHTAAYDIDDCRDARRRFASTATASARERRRRSRPRSSSSTAPRCATCATARTRTSRRPGMRSSRRRRAGPRPTSSRARSCRTPTCSISTRPRASCSSSTSRPAW